MKLTNETLAKSLVVGREILEVVPDKIKVPSQNGIAVYLMYCSELNQYKIGASVNTVKMAGTLRSRRHKGFHIVAHVEHPNAALIVKELKKEYCTMLPSGLCTIEDPGTLLEAFKCLKNS